MANFLELEKALLKKNNKEKFKINDKVNTKLLYKYKPSVKTATNMLRTILKKYNKQLENQICLVLAAPTQSGKTGVLVLFCFLVIKQLIKRYPNKYGWTKKNIDVIYYSNISDNELKKQNEERFTDTGLDQFCNFNSYHNGNYKKLEQALSQKNENNFGICLFDESHVANKNDSRYNKALDLIKNSYTNYIIINVSATNYTYYSNIRTKLEASNINFFYHKPGDSYHSVKWLYENNYLINKKSSTIVDKNQQVSKECVTIFREFKAEFDADDNEGSIAIVRLQNEKSIEKVKVLTKWLEKEGYDVKEISTQSKDNCSVLKGGSYDKPRVVIVRGAFRAGKSFENKKHIKLIIDGASKEDDTLLQGLLGRMTGYPKLHPDLKIYCRLSSMNTINKHEEILKEKENNALSEAIGTTPSSSGNKDITRKKINYRLNFEYKTAQELELYILENKSKSREERYLRTSRRTTKTTDGLRSILKSETTTIENNILYSNGFTPTKDKFEFIILDGPCNELVNRNRIGDTEAVKKFNEFLIKNNIKDTENNAIKLIENIGIPGLLERRAAEDMTGINDGYIITFEETCYITNTAAKPNYTDVYIATCS